MDVTFGNAHALEIKPVPQGDEAIEAPPVVEVERSAGKQGARGILYVEGLRECRELGLVVVAVKHSCQELVIGRCENFLDRGTGRRGGRRGCGNGRRGNRGRPWRWGRLCREGTAVARTEDER